MSVRDVAFNYAMKSARNLSKLVLRYTEKDPDVSTEVLVNAAETVTHALDAFTGYGIPGSLADHLTIDIIDALNSREIFERRVHVSEEFKHEADAAIAATTWQPIETIPDELKDRGKIVLLWNGEVIERGWFDNTCGKRWFMENLGPQTPLLWMPLPEPPK